MKRFFGINPSESQKDKWVIIMSDNKPVRILQINSGSQNFGGVSSFLYNVYTHIDRTKVQFDFLSPNVTTYGIHKKEIKEMGGRIIQLGIDGNILTKKLRLYIGMKEYFKKHPYSIVHINSGNFFFNLFVAKAAKKAKIRNIYIHSHSIEIPTIKSSKKKLTAFFKKSLSNSGTRLLACSKEAAEYMFDETKVKDAEIIRNGVNIERFKYDPEARQEIRRKLGIEDKHVIGHVGNFLPPKNHPFLVDVFAKLAKKDENAVLLLIGTGENKEKIQTKIQELGLSDKVIILGTQKDIEKYYQAMDVFLFPSSWEGLGMVLVEAQISGLPCIASTGVPREAAVSDEAVFIDVTKSDSINKWVETILSNYGKNRQSRIEDAYRCGYDVDDVSSKLEGLYLKDAK